MKPCKDPIIEEINAVREAIAREAGDTSEEIVMAKTETLSWDAAEQLDTEEDMAAYLEAALEIGEPSLVTAALSDIDRAKGSIALRPHAASPFDVAPVRSRATTQDILDAIRESRERD